MQEEPSIDTIDKVRPGKPRAQPLASQSAYASARRRAPILEREGMLRTPARA